MLINASHPEENRVAIVVDGILSDLDIEIAGQEQTKGNIYKAVVSRVEPGLQAAFVDYGSEKMGFLQIGEIHPSLYPDHENTDPRNRPRINEILKRGQEILVQIVKEERGTKGAALTTFLSLAGRYMVLMPDSKTKGVSRKITNESERKLLKKTMAALDLPEGTGYIVRTAGIGKEQDELKRDFDYLVSLYAGIIAHKEKVKAPAQIYQESNLVIRSIRDYFSSEMDEVLIDDPRVYNEAKDFFRLVMPDQGGLVRQHRERRPIFSRFQIEDQIDGLTRNQIPLPSGGSIVIDQTEALVAIDVNSGKMSSESGIEATAGKTNLEAAAEVGRQLRLRDLGGLVVIDFIDMRDRKRIRDVEQALKYSLRDDKAKVTVGRISQFGLLEMSRQRIKAALSVGASLECPHCQGKGQIKSIEAQAIALLRQIHASASKGQIGTIQVKAPFDVAIYLLNEKRQSLSDLEKQLNLSIRISGHTDFIPGQTELEMTKREKLPQDDHEQAPISHTNRAEEPAAEATSEETDDKKESSDTAEETEAEETGRKRRRRRRRRSRKDTPQATEETAAVESTSDQPDQTEEPEPKNEPASPEMETKEEAPAQKRGLRSDAKPQQEIDERTAEAPSTAAAGPDKAPDEKTAAAAASDERPKRTRSKRAPARRKQGDSVSETAAEAPTSAETAAPEEVEGGEKKAPTKRASAPRKTTRKPAKAKQTEQLEETEAAAAPPAEESAPTEAESKPKRRPTKKSTSGATPKQPAVKKTRTTATKETAPLPSAESEPAAEKPKRAPRKKKTDEASASETEPAVTDQTVTPAAKARKPAPRKKATPKQKTTATEQAVTASEEQQSQQKAKTPRKKAAAKTAPKAAPQQDQSGTEATEKTAPARKKPARKKTTTSETTAITAAPAPEAAPAETEDSAPKKATARRKTVKKEAGTTDSGESPPPKRKTTRKSAAKAEEDKPSADQTPKKTTKKAAPKRTATQKTEVAEDDASSPQEKPVRKRAPRKKKTPEPDASKD